MADASWPVGEETGAGRVDLLAELDLIAALEHVEGLVEALVQMSGRPGAWRSRQLEKREQAPGVQRAQQEAPFLDGPAHGIDLVAIDHLAGQHSHLQLRSLAVSPASVAGATGSSLESR